MTTLRLVEVKNNNHSYPRQAFEKIGIGLVKTISAVVSAPFRALKDFAKAIAAPALCGATILTVMHVIARPKESLEIVKNFPSILQATVHKIPDAYYAARNVTTRIYQGATGPNGIAKKFRDFKTAAQDPKKKENLQNFCESILKKAEGAYATVTKEAAKKFNESFPPITPPTGI